MTRWAWVCATVLFTTACGDDGGTSDAESSTGPAASSSSTSTDPGTSTGPASSSSGDADSSSSNGEASSSTGVSTSSSTGDIVSCDPVVPGEFNACIDENGDIDNTLCNWMGTGDSVGMAACLTGPVEGSNVCMIRDCVDDCDCFAAPATGTAVPQCREVLADNGMACVLTCADGETCPDGMSCESGLCFYLPPA